MDTQQKVIFLQKKVKQIGLLSIATLVTVVIVLISRNLATKHPDSVWEILSPIFLGLVFLIAVYLLIFVIHTAYTIFKK